MNRHRRARRIIRRIAYVLIPPFVWSSTFARAAEAVAQAPRPPIAVEAARTRRLTPDEMRGIVGAQGSGGISYSSGPSYGWEGSDGGTNTANGNKLTSVSLLGWTQLGGLPVGITLYHCSKSAQNGAVGQKWSHTYVLYTILDITNGNVDVHWGDDLAYTFTHNMDGSYSPPAGIHDTLTSITGGYKIVTPRQVTYNFTSSNGGYTRWCSTIKDLNSNTITLTYSGPNPFRLSSVKDQTNRTISFSYDGSNRITTITDPMSRQWSLSYNGSSELTQVSWPAVGGSTYTHQFAYDAGGRHDLTTLTDRRGNNWVATYDTSDNVLTWKDPANNQTSYSYATGQTTITDPNSNVVKHNYDGSLRLTSVVDALNNSESYQYDSSNNRTQVTDRRSNNWSCTFDSNGNILTATDPLTHSVTLTYNSLNEPLSVTDALSNQEVATYDANGNPTQIQAKDSGGSVLSTTTFTWNTNGTLASKTDSNSHTTSYGYNSNGHLTSVTTPNSRVTSWTVNTLGVRTGQTDALNRTTSYTLDNWHRVTTVTYPNSSTKTFSYDANSSMTGWTDGQGTWSRTYDSSNRVTNESLNSTTRFSYSYDAAGKKGLLSSVTDATPRTVAYGYTARNQLYTVSDSAGTATYGYDNNGNGTSITNPNSTTVTNVFDGANRLTSVTNKNSSNTTLSSFSYGYNNDNTRSSCTELNGDVVSYGYDAAHRLTSESRTGSSSYSYTYTVDGVGNRTSQVKGGTTTNFTLNSDDELTATSGGFSNSYSYNANGEQTGRTLGATTYTLAYDYDGQLTSSTVGGATTSFAYDALGRRFSRTAGGTTSQFLSSGSQVWLESIGSTITATYTYGNGLVRKDGEYPMFDGLGSERTVTNSSQTVTGTITFEGFGSTIATTGSSANPYKFAATSGYRDDGDAGLMHVGARYYDPQVGRFITRDSELGEHPYAYCSHNPVNFLDPSGHFALALSIPWPWLWGAVAGATMPAWAVPVMMCLIAAAVGAAAGYIYANRWNPSNQRTIPHELPRPPVTDSTPKEQFPNSYPPLWPDGTPGDQPYHPPFTEPGPEPFPWPGGG